MATTALYRISSKEVIKISLTGQAFADRNPTYWGVLTDPELPDGHQTREVIGGVLGPLRALGFAKIAIVGSNTARNATAEEIAGWAVAEDDDTKRQDADRAQQLLDHPQFGKLFAAILKEVESTKPLGQQRALASIKASVKSRVNKDE